jgi:hypothetical protein
MSTDKTNVQNGPLDDKTVSVRLHGPHRKALKRLQEHRDDVNCRSDAIREAIEHIDQGASISDDGGPTDFHTPDDPRQEQIYRAAVDLAGGPQQSTLRLRENELPALAQKLNNDQDTDLAPDVEQMRRYLLSLGERHVRQHHAPADNEVHRRYHIRHPNVEPESISTDRGSQRAPSGVTQRGP